MEKTRFMDRASPPHTGTLVIMTGAGALNMNVILPSLPGIAEHFDVSYSLAALLISTYLGATALMQLIVGPLSDHYGRRPVMLISTLIFLVSTLACIFAPNYETLLIARLVQTSIVSGLALSRAAVRDMVSADEAASLFGYITMGMALVPMVGPIIGGSLDEIYGWQAAFFVTFFFGLLVLVLVYFDMGETNHHISDSFASQFRAYPELFRSRRFWGYALSAACTSGSFFAFLGGAPYISINMLGLSQTAFGVYFALTGVGYILGNFLSGRYAVRVGINLMMLFGNLVVIFGMLGAIAVFSLGYTHPMVFFGFMVFLGLGNGLTLPSANAGVVSVRPHLAGSASGLGGALMIGGGAGLSVLSGWLLGPDTGPYPMFYLMLTAASAGACMALYVIHVARKVTRESF